MQELKIKNNPSGLQVFINGAPQIEQIDSAQLEVVVKVLEKMVNKHYGKSNNDKNAR